MKQAIAAGKASIKETERPVDDNLWEIRIHWQIHLATNVPDNGKQKMGQYWRSIIIEEPTSWN